MRFEINIQDSENKWIADIRCDEKQWTRRMLALDDGKGGLFPFPADDVPAAGLAAKSAADVLAVYTEIVNRKPEHIVDYGRYLFDNLLGDPLWQDMIALSQDKGEQLIELALSWPLNESNLSRLHWEMMHDGAQFLAA